MVTPAITLVRSVTAIEICSPGPSNLVVVPGTRGKYGFVTFVVNPAASMVGAYEAPATNSDGLRARDASSDADADADAAGTAEATGDPAAPDPTGDAAGTAEATGLAATAEATGLAATAGDAAAPVLDATTAPDGAAVPQPATSMASPSMASPRMASEPLSFGNERSMVMVNLLFGCRTDSTVALTTRLVVRRPGGSSSLDGARRGRSDSVLRVRRPAPPCASLAS